MNHVQRNFSFVSGRPAGFSLLEIMVALALGALLTIGIVSLFGTTSRTNQLQDGLARLQENGRYAVARISSDLRMTGAQFCSNRSGNAIPSTVAPAWAGRAPMVFAANLGLPDSGGMNSVDVAGAASTASAAAPYALSPRYFVQGYACSVGPCTPPASVPAAGLADGSRVPNTDVFTVRYQRGTGWPLTAVSGSTCTTGGTLTVSPQPGDDPVSFTAGQLAVVTDCQNPSILPVAASIAAVIPAVQTDITLGAILPGSPPVCTPSALRDVRVFNFSTDFVTITYFLRFALDTSPSAKPNSGAGRLIPALIRQENGVAQEIVQGVDLLEFRYGVQDVGGNTRYLTAAEVDSRLGGAITCPFKPDGVNPDPSTPTSFEPGCLWRSVRSVDAHLLMNTVNDLSNLDATSRAYRFNSPAWVATVDTTPLPSGLRAGTMLRREFIAQTISRNYNP